MLIHIYRFGKHLISGLALLLGSFHALWCRANQWTTPVLYGPPLKYFFYFKITKIPLSPFSRGSSHYSWVRGFLWAAPPARSSRHLGPCPCMACSKASAMASGFARACASDYRGWEVENWLAAKVHDEVPDIELRPHVASIFVTRSCPVTKTRWCRWRWPPATCPRSSRTYVHTPGPRLASAPVVLYMCFFFLTSGLVYVLLMYN